MNKDRLVQLVALFAAVITLVGAAVLIPAINTQRRDLQLSYDPVTGDVPPHIALLTTAAGSFRGILVDALWYRAEMQKRDGKYHEANTLAEAIVTLQPRFPQVWAFNAWNQAYNISVGTYTAEERWDWVSKGERMLRTRGIPYNPNAVLLYKELAWIWFHKIGGNTDDFHNYYKYKVAERWDQLLGSPPGGAPKPAVLAWFEPVRGAADRYFVFDRPSHQMAQKLDALEAAAPPWADAIDPLRELDVIRLRDRLLDLKRDPPTRNEGARAILDELITLAEDARSRSQSDPLTMLFTDHPQTQALVEALETAGWGVDDESIEQTVRAVGRLQGLFRASGFDPGQFVQWAQMNLPAGEQTLARIMFAADFDQAWRQLLPFLRARALVNVLHMDPGQMYDTMDTYGPLDWRHPYSHALYFSRLGVEKSGILIDRTKVDILNTYRGIIHALQGLRDLGRVNFDPLAGRVSFQPDPRFIDPYLAAVVEGKDWITDTEGRVDWGSGVLTSFESGHENFLQTAVVTEYLYGREDKARQYYQQLRQEYGDKPHNIREGRYNLAMEEFITTTYLQDGDMQTINRATVDGLIFRAIIEGLAEQRADVFNRFIGLASAAHRRYNEMRANPSSTAYAGQERLALPSLREVLVPDALAAFLTRGGYPLDVRSRVYQFAPGELQRAVYRKIRQPILQQLGAAIAADPDAASGSGPRVDAATVFDRLFPRPAGLPEQEQAPKPEEEAAPPAGTIQRQ